MFENSLRVSNSQVFSISIPGSVVIKPSGSNNLPIRGPAMIRYVAKGRKVAALLLPSALPVSSRQDYLFNFRYRYFANKFIRFKFYAILRNLSKIVAKRNSNYFLFSNLRSYLVTSNFHGVKVTRNNQIVIFRSSGQKNFTELLGTLSNRLRNKKKNLRQRRRFIYFYQPFSQYCVASSKCFALYANRKVIVMYNLRIFTLLFHFQSKISLYVALAFLFPTYFNFIFSKRSTHNLFFRLQGYESENFVYNLHLIRAGPFRKQYTFYLLHSLFLFIYYYYATIGFL